MATANLLLHMLGALWAASAAGEAAAAGPAVAFRQAPGKVVVTVGGQPVATYVYADKVITRPYFAHARAPGGIQVTRNHPPVRGKDPADHATYHPGIWLAFGDLGGADCWRNRAKVVHEAFEQKPEGGAGRGGFAVRNRYLARAKPGRVVCRELCRYTFHVRPYGYLLVWDSTFWSEDGEFHFGDQEEMGLGVRVATPITVKSGGKILSSTGGVNERGVWGKAADWCDYSGTIGARRVGAALMGDPGNFRRPWFHARDYGLLVANPFGRKAFRKGTPSKVVVPPGQRFRLRFGVLLHSGPAGSAPDLKAAYADFLRLLGKPRDGKGPRAAAESAAARQPLPPAGRRAQ